MSLMTGDEKRFQRGLLTCPPRVPILIPVMRKNNPLTITKRIAEALGQDTGMADALQVVRYKAVAEIVSSFLNYTGKNEVGQQGFFAGMIIRILQPDEKAVHFSDLQTVINVIKEGDKAILDEMRSEREEWLSARKADRELATA